MLGMNEAQYNAARAKCRDCTKEIKANLEKIDPKKRSAEFNAISTAAIDKHHKPVESLLGRVAFIWLCGYLEGRFGAGIEY